MNNNELWIARCKAGHLHAFNRKPFKGEASFYTPGTDNTLRLPRHWFKDVTFENSPVLVKLVHK